MTKFAIDDPRHPGVKDGGYTTFANKDDDPTLMFCKCDYGNVECHRLMHKHVRLCHANKTVFGVLCQHGGFTDIDSFLFQHNNVCPFKDHKQCKDCGYTDIIFL